MFASHFQIGKSHKVCQDYAIHTDKLAVLSDGCSSSLNTDVGARLLCHSVIKTVDFDDYAAVYLTAGHSAELLGLDLSALDATLWVLSVDGDTCLLDGVGDGLCATIFEESSISVKEVHYTASYPCYLTYLFNKELRDSFLEVKQKCIHKEYSIEGDKIEDGLTYSADLTTGVALATYKDDCKAIVVCSDGIFSFVDSEGNSIPASEVLKKLLKFKTYTEGFLERRMNFFNKEMDKLGWVHQDDLSIIAYTEG